MSKYGISYMGSKDKICESICMVLPKAENFYDLFGGGFSISHCMVMNRSDKYKTFHYNEIKADIVDLVKRAIAGEFSYDRFKPEWISREMFFARLDDPYIRVCWSFGNNQRDYLFGKDIEQYKKSMHQAVVFDEFDDTAKSVFVFDIWPVYVKTIKQKRYFLRQKASFNKRDVAVIKRGDLQQLQQLLRLEKLEQLERLERLQQLERLPKLTLTSLSYHEVQIKPNSVVYCDPPYANTVDYNAKFDHVTFLDWAATRPFPVYISEYNIDDSRFKLVYKIDKRSNLSAEKSVGNKLEKLYWNGISND